MQAHELARDRVHLRAEALDLRVLGGELRRVCLVRLGLGLGLGIGVGLGLGLGLGIGVGLGLGLGLGVGVGVGVGLKLRRACRVRAL